MLECRACGLAQTDPYPGDGDIADLYANGISSDYEMPESGIIGRLKDVLAKRTVRAIARRARLVPDRILDFGTGAGRYAAAAGAAFPRASITGTDFANVPPVGSYYERYPDISYVPYSQLRAHGRFDLVLARHVLEHVSNPKKLVAEWLGFLTPKGRLYIEVPNLLSATAKLAGPRWPLWYVPKHLSHFTAHTLRRIVEAAGGDALIGTCEMPMMGNVVALRTGHSRFDPRFKLAGVALHPLQLALEAVAREGTCLYAIVQSSKNA